MSESPKPRDEERERSPVVEEKERPRYVSPPDDRVRSRSREAARERRRSPRSPRSPRSRSPRSPVDRRDRDREDANNGCIVYVAKLSSGTREADLKEGFSLFGDIKSIALKQKFAFITFDKPEQATEAIKKMNGAKFVNGEELVVEQSGTF